MTEQPGGESPGRPRGEEPEPPRPPLSTDWAAQQPPAQGWADPGYGQQPGQPPPPPPPAAGQQQGWAAQPPPAAGQQQGWAAQPPPAAGQQQGWAAQPPPAAGWGQPPGTGWGQPPGWGPAQQAWLPPKPGVIPLRPLGIGEILDGAISTIRAKPRLMLGLSAVVAVLTQLVTLPITWVLLHDAGDQAFTLEQGNTSSESDAAYTASSFVAVVTQLGVTLFATLLLTGMLTVVLSRAVLGQDIDARQAWDQTRPRLLALIGVTVVVFLIEMVIITLLLAPGIVLAVSGAPAVAIALAFVVGIPLLLFLVPYLYVSFALAPAAVVLEKQPVIGSLTRSRRLVKGAWWRTFGILVLVNIIASIVSGIFSGIFTVAAFFAAGLMSGFDSFNPYTLVPLIITAIGSIVAGAITWPFTAVATALLYVDRRMRREGLDIELARAAGFTAVGQSTTPGTELDGSQYGGAPSPVPPPPPPYDG